MKNIVEEILKAKKEAGGIREVYFVACGGSLGAFYPAKVFLETEGVKLKTGWYNSNEFVHNIPKSFGENTVLILASHKGNTPETVKAAELGKERGAAVIALTWIPESPITKFADYVVEYSFGEDKDIGEEKTMQGLLLAVEILKQTEGYENYDKFMDGVSKIDLIVKKACKLVRRRAEAFAEQYKNDSVIYTIGSGAGYGAAYMECICIFMEMQWNISMDLLRLRTGRFPLFCSFRRGKPGRWTKEHWHFWRNMGNGLRFWTRRNWDCPP